jgi:hypothetical protein
MNTVGIETRVDSTPDACIGFFGLGFAFNNFEKYPDYFKDDSYMTVAEAGTYTGAADIE